MVEIYNSNLGKSKSVNIGSDIDGIAPSITLHCNKRSGDRAFLEFEFYPESNDLNKIEQSQYWGWQTFYKKSSEESKKLAECVQKGISEEISDRQNKREALSISNKYLTDNIKIPTTIVECGFLSNPEEAELLQQDEYQNKLVNGIYNGIKKYFE